MSVAVAISQRVQLIAEYGERRDCLDQQWAAFLHACDLLPIPVPNFPTGVDSMLSHARVRGIVLTGGENLAAFGGTSPERDATEQALLTYARRENLPVLGVCRGMQHLVHSCGGTLRSVAGHVACSHTIDCEGRTRVVNSFHSLAADRLPDELEIVASCTDGVVEAVRHRSAPWFGIMWHPERNPSPDAADVALFHELFHSS